ncbi:MAG: DNA-binding protein [Firmicutes bacterium HGW-Firmicutes-7]|nr:MAG: DNA-binding protein [Firmicutes bacterium HGW-Firmicutes-7]
MNGQSDKDITWVCHKCNQNLALKKVKVRYLEGNFEVELMKCTKCNMVYIGEDLALGKMLEVEKGLEDK